MIDVELLGVHQVIQNAPVIVLRERDGLRRLLPIYIGDPEARSIQLAVEGVEPQRPLTHDLILDLLGALGTDIDEILIT
ncbi:MAG: bifunctional nuclease family protein, partial [Acidimicrobiia bacterium]|nr:bifunctional nuclease family protein [Acidimicrobiia bacterium]